MNAKATRDGEVLKSVADQVKALREDVRRLNREREEATQDIVKVATAGLRLELKELMATAKGDATEELANACRSNYEQLEAMIRGRGA